MQAVFHAPAQLVYLPSQTIEEVIAIMRDSGGTGFSLLLLGILLYAGAKVWRRAPEMPDALRHALATIRRWCAPLAYFFSLVLKSADRKMVTPEDEAKTGFRVARFAVLSVSRCFLLTPVIYYSHLPSITPNLSVIPRHAAIMAGVFCICVFICRSAADVFCRKREAPFFIQALYCLIAVCMAVLWYPMLYIAAFVFKWFCPVLGLATAITVFFAIKTRRPVVSAIAQISAAVSITAFVAAMETFMIVQSCEGYRYQAPVSFYINYCEPGRQIIPEKTLASHTDADQRKTLRMRHRTALQHGDRVFIGASSRYSFVYDLKTRMFASINCGVFSLYEDPVTQQYFLVCPQSRTMLVYDSPRLYEKYSLDLRKYGGPYWIEGDPSLRRLFVGLGETGKWRALVYDMDDTDSFTTESLGNAHGGSIGETSYGNDNKLVYYIEAFNQNRAGSFDLMRGKVRATRALPWFAIAVHYRHDTNSVFLTSPITSFDNGSVIELDGDTLATRKIMRSPVGSKDITFASDGYLYLTNYLTGELYRIDWHKMKILGSLRVGRKVKRMEYNQQLDILTCSSEWGYLKIDLSRWR